MDEDFRYFLEKMGPAFERQNVRDSSMDLYRGKLPDQLLNYWDEYGWCGYADGLFWTVDPQEFEPALKAWIGDTPFMQQDAYHVIARSAFGHLYCWGERTGFSLLVSSLGSFAVPYSPSKGELETEIQWFFGISEKKGKGVSEFLCSRRVVELVL